MARWPIIAVVVVAGCSGSTSTRMPVANAPAAPPKTAAAAATASQSCIPLSRIREARVVDDRTIDFYLGGREVLRNTLPNSCPQLGFEKAFTYATSLSQLCSVDIIRVVVQGGGPRLGASCGLGAFVPFTPPAK